MFLPATRLAPVPIAASADNPCFSGCYANYELRSKLITISTFFRGILRSAFSAFLKEQALIEWCLSEENGGRDGLSLTSVSCLIFDAAFLSWPTLELFIFSGELLPFFVPFADVLGHVSNRHCFFPFYLALLSSVIA